MAENHFDKSPYHYVMNNPMLYVDPLGLDTIGVHHLDMAMYKEDVDVVQLDEVSVSGNRSVARNYGGDGSGSLADKFMYGLDQANQYLPTTHLLNSFTYAFTGRDFMGNEMGAIDAYAGTLSVIPIGKVAGAAVSYPRVYRSAHFLKANKSLNATMAVDPRFASSMSALGINIPKSSEGSILGKSPANWVWHHDINVGVMQLVPKSQHTIGSTFWNTLHPVDEVVFQFGVNKIYNMKLTDLIKDIGNIDQEAIIFQEDRDNPNSDIIVSSSNEGCEEVKEVGGRKYYYLIEVFLAKEFVEDWEASLDYRPTAEEKAKRLYDYAINDA